MASARAACSGFSSSWMPLRSEASGSTMLASSQPAATYPLREGQTSSELVLAEVVAQGGHGVVDTAGPREHGEAHQIAGQAGRQLAQRAAPQLAGDAIGADPALSQCRPLHAAPLRRCRPAGPVPVGRGGAVGEPFGRAVPPEVPRAGQGLGRSQQTELGKAFTVQLELDPVDGGGGLPVFVPDVKPPVDAGAGDVDGLVVDPGGDGAGVTLAEVEAGETPLRFVGAHGVRPAHEAGTVLEAQVPALEIGVQVDATDREAQLTALSEQQGMEPLDGAGGAGSVEEGAAELNSDRKSVVGRGEADPAVRMVEAVAVLAPPMRCEIELVAAEVERNRHGRPLRQLPAVLESVQ